MRKGFTISALIPSFFAIRSRISRAALFVNVTQKIDRGSIPRSCIIWTTRSVMVWVFPDQAHALIKRGQSICSTASSCAGFKFRMSRVYRKRWKKREIFWGKSVFLYTCVMQHIFSSSLFSRFPNIIQGTSSKYFWPLSFTYEKSTNMVVIDRVRFLDALWLDVSHAVMLCEQNHTANIIHITEENIGHGYLDQSSQIPNADGMITNIANIHLIVYTADCVPISFYDPVRNVIALAHSGWKWTISEIGKKIIDEMIQNYGSQSEDIYVSLWPSIGPCCYEVKNPEQLELFEKKYHNLRVHEGKNYVDLWDSISQDMMNAGILPEHFENMKLCTVCHHDTFASHRKDNPNTTANLTGVSMRS